LYKVGQKTKTARGYYAHIFNTREPVCMIFGKLQRDFVVNTSVNSDLIKFTTQSSATWRTSATWI